MSKSAIELQIDHVLAEVHILRGRVAILERRVGGPEDPLVAEVNDLKSRLDSLENTVANLKQSIAGLVDG